MKLTYEFEIKEFLLLGDELIGYDDLQSLEYKVRQDAFNRLSSAIFRSITRKNNV